MTEAPRSGAAPLAPPDALAVASEVGRTLAAVSDIGEMLSHVACRVAGALGVWECDILEYREESHALVAAAVWAQDMDERDAAWVGTVYDLHEWPSYRRLVEERRTREVHRTDAGLDQPDAASMDEWGELSILSVPLVFADRVIGALALIEKREDRRFGEEELHLLDLLAVPAAVAVQSSGMLRREARQNQRLDLLLHSMRAISSSMDLDDVLATVARTAGELLGADQCQIQDYDAETGMLVTVAYWMRRPDLLAPAAAPRPCSLAAGPEERAFLQAKRVVQQLRSDDGLAAPTRDQMDACGDRSYLKIPLVFNDRSFGVMVLTQTAEERRWSDEDVAFGAALAEQAAVAVENARLYKRVQAQALTDGLTGLYNHRYFYERLEHEVVRARRYATPVSLLMIDLDDFKVFNDRHGHPAGDAVLRTVAGVLRSELRQQLDIAARYGGEEFAVILPNTPMQPAGGGQMAMDMTCAIGGGEPPGPGHRDGAEAVAERIRRRIGETEIPAAGGRRPTRLTVSIGVAVFPLRTDSLEDLVANADAALYKAKRGGKDRVERYG
jgi:GGDEF domain-containing protein